MSCINEILYMQEKLFLDYEKLKLFKDYKKYRN